MRGYPRNNKDLTKNDLKAIKFVRNRLQVSQVYKNLGDGFLSFIAHDGRYNHFPDVRDKIYGLAELEYEVVKYSDSFEQGLSLLIKDIINDKYDDEHIIMFKSALEKYYPQLIFMFNKVNKIKVLK